MGIHVSDMYQSVVNLSYSSQKMMFIVILTNTPATHVEVVTFNPIIVERSDPGLQLTLEV